MAVVGLIWRVAAGLSAGAVLWMAALLLLRLAHQRRADRRAADRRCVEQAMIGLLLGKAEAQPALAPYAGRGRLMAETLLDFLGLVRGADREAVLAACRRLKVDETLRGRLRRGSEAGRLASIEALSAFPSPETEAALRRLAADARPHLRLAALKSLAASGAPPSLERVMADIVSGTLPRSALLGELLRVVVGADVAAAVAALADPQLDPAIRLLLVEGLGAAGDYAAMPALAEAVQAGAPDLRAAAVDALGRLRHPAAHASFAAALADAEWQVRAAAATAIGEAHLPALADALAGRLADPVWRVRFQAAGALAKLGEPGRAALREAANSDIETVKSAAALALAERGLAA